MPENVKFLIGNETLVKKRIEEIKSAIQNKRSSINILIYYAPEVNLQDIKNDIINPSLFTENKVIIIQHAELFDKKTWEKLLKTITRVPEEIDIIIAGDSFKKSPGEDYTVEILEEKDESPEKQIYRFFRRRYLKPSEIMEKITLFIRENPYKQPIIISAFEQYIQQLFLDKKISFEEFQNKIEYLNDLDYKIKSGKIDSTPGWETLLLRLILV
ncbi:MAG: hypothetical protein M1135_02980 [Candidatus Omnitrophica bacterium]|nr:hypothetical protein [Candidatus Omnitrophota bacterium]